MQKSLKALSILVASIMFLGMVAACGQNSTPTAAPTEAPTAAPTEAPTSAPTEAPTEVPTEAPKDIPLVVAYNAFSQKFSPFFADTGYDVDVAGMTQISLLTTDRVGGIIANAIEGETRNFNGTDYLYTGAADTMVEFKEEEDVTVYTAKLREGMKFSDGEPVTADDIIFTYYTFLDPSYVGSTSLSSFGILGLKDYQTQTTSDVYDKYAVMADALYEAGPDHVHAETDAWSQEMQDDYWTTLNAGWKADVQSIVDYVMANYLDGYGEATTGKTVDEIKADEGLQVAFGIALWGFGEIDTETGILTTSSGKTFDLATTKPTVDDYYAEAVAKYGEAQAYVDAGESPNAVDFVANAKSAFIGKYGPLDTDMGGTGVPNIAGIKKIDDLTVEVTVTGFEAPAVYSILGVNVTPLHYYGDRDMYDYENNKFGFAFGDLSKQLSLTATPMGAGAYKFDRYDNKIVYFTANEFYYKGEPKIKEIQFKETVSAEVASALQTGTADAGELNGTKTRFEEIASYNTNGEITGDIITTSKVDNLGYGYIGLNADTVNVAGEPDSDASKNLRRGLATVLAAYRTVANDSYYGDAASVINYPISNTSWAAPQPTDEGYRVAFSMDADGNEIYTAEQTPEERYAAALQGALTFFEAAGFTVTDGVLTAAPEGAKLSYEVIVPGDGTGEHPAFAILTAAQESLAKIGMELKINDPADSNVLWDALDSSTQELWTAAWGATIDPDMYQVYHSSGIVGLGGSDSNHYHIADPELDQLILDARKSDDQNYRKAIYKQALDVVIDWAVEIPNYQRQNCIVFSTERINIETLTPDITTFWGWLNDIELLEMNQN